MYGANGNPWLTFSAWTFNHLHVLWVDVNFGEWVSLHNLEKPLTHVWMHICADIDTKNGNFSVSLNGRNMKKFVISSLKVNKPRILSLEIGLSKLSFVGEDVKQFYGSVTNINVFKFDYKISIEHLSSHLCDYTGDYMSWKDASVQLKGPNVKQTRDKNNTVCETQSEIKLVLPNKYTQMEAQHCCEILGGGRMPGVNNKNELDKYVTLIQESQNSCSSVWVPISDEVEEGEWRNIYTGNIETYLPWAPKQPNGETSQNSAALSLDVLSYNDVTKTDKFCASCTLNVNTTFRLQGVCPQSYLGEYF